jgi:hypothetical protein
MGIFLAGWKKALLLLLPTQLQVHRCVEFVARLRFCMNVKASPSCTVLAYMEYRTM